MFLGVMVQLLARYVVNRDDWHLLMAGGLAGCKARGPAFEAANKLLQLSSSASCGLHLGNIAERELELRDM